MSIGNGNETREMYKPERRGRRGRRNRRQQYANHDTGDNRENLDTQGGRANKDQIVAEAQDKYNDLKKKREETNAADDSQEQHRQREKYDENMKKISEAGKRTKLPNMSEVHGPGTTGYEELLKHNKEKFLNLPSKAGDPPNEKSNKESWADPAKALRTNAQQQVAIHCQGNELYWLKKDAQAVKSTVEFISGDYISTDVLFPIIKQLSDDVQKNREELREMREANRDRDVEVAEIKLQTAKTDRDIGNLYHNVRSLQQNKVGKQGMKQAIEQECKKDKTILMRSFGGGKDKTTFINLCKMDMPNRKAQVIHILATDYNLDPKYIAAHLELQGDKGEQIKEVYPKEAIRGIGPGVSRNLTPEEIEKLNTDVVVVFHGTYDAQMIMKLYHKNLAEDKAKLENQPPIILEGYREDGDSQGVENKRWREALDEVNKNTITKLTEIPDLKDIWGWFKDDHELCTKIEEHQYMGAKTRDRGLATLNGKFASETSKRLNLELASEADVKQKARHIRSAIRHAVSYAKRTEEREVNEGDEAIDEDGRRQIKEVLDAVGEAKPFLDEIDKAMQRHY